MITLEGLTKRYGDKVAVDHLSCTIRSGAVTGFLGPNGAGKSTTMRMIVGLDRPTAGQVTVNGSFHVSSPAPLTEVGALLDAKSLHPGRSPRNHLRALAATHGIPDRRVDEVIDMVGLGPVASKRVGGFSLGMNQRVGIASAMLGDPGVLLFDEPVNGLDPEGVRWVRELCVTLAKQGRTVLISSHLMSEMSQTATDLVIVGKGRLLAQTTVDEFTAAASGRRVRVGSPEIGRVRAVLDRHGIESTESGADTVDVRGTDTERIARIALDAGLLITELHTISASLEDAFMNLTEESIEYHSTSLVSASKEK